MICPNCGQTTMDRAICTHCGAALFATYLDDAGDDSDIPSEYVQFTTGSGVMNIFGLEEATASAASVAAPAPAPTTQGHLVVHLDANFWGSSSEFTVPLDGHEVTVGRSPGCTISLDNDSHVSRHHAIIHCSDSGYVITDLGSSNGTLVNGAQIAHETALREGDLIQIGECEIIFSTSPMPAPSDAAAVPSSSGTIPAINMTSDRVTDPSVSQVIALPPVSTDGAVRNSDQTTAISADTAALMNLAAAPTEPLVGQIARTPPAEPVPDLDAIQTQLTGMVGELKRQAEAAAREVDRLKTEIDTVTATLATLVEADRQLAASGPDIMALIQLSNRTVESPRHLDNVVEFAAQAAQIGAALQALQDIRSSFGFVAAVDSLRARLAALG